MLPQKGHADRLPGVPIPRSAPYQQRRRIAQFSLGTTRRWNDCGDKPREDAVALRLLVELAAELRAGQVVPPREVTWCRT